MFAASIAFLLSAAASTPSYPGFEALASSGDDKFLCTSDGDICISSSEPGALKVMRGDDEAISWSPGSDSDDATVEPMPAVIHLAGGRVLIGALVTRRTSYSGGGGSSTDQVLALVEPDKSIKPVLSVPEESSLSIRACFTEKQYKDREGACSAEFRSDGTLAASPSGAGQLPTLRFRLEASHFPRGASRYDDSSGVRLRKDDLKWEDDPHCTFERSFHFDPAQGKYIPDTALPDCSDYTDP